jgi:formate dehydrogenase maturation protein FdhE
VDETWDRRIRRAEQLTVGGGPESSLLAFYARLLQSQKAVYESFEDRGLSGSIEQDVPQIARNGAALLHDVADNGPDQLVAEARTLLQGDDSTRHDLLLTYWNDRSDRKFFAKALLQPYGQWLATAGLTAISQRPARGDNRCPRCGGAPQLSILETAGAVSADGSSRQLLCATCLATWPFRRVVCPQCGEDDERKLGYFQSSAFEHVRVDACDSCGRYLKSIDVGRLGLAVPLVDEVAGASLDVWALEHGYQKIELNLLGL